MMPEGVIIALCVGLGVLLLGLEFWHIWVVVKQRSRAIELSKSPPLSPDATKVLYGLRDSNDPHFYPISERSLLQSLSELEDAGLIEAAGDRVFVTASGSRWGRG
jgi:hypothetical protein